MVLVSNEWQNKCEDVPKTTAITNTSTVPTSSTLPTPATSSASGISEGPETKFNTKINKKSETVAGDFINSITATDSIISALTIATGTPANDNASNEEIHEIIKDKNCIEITYKNNINHDDDINECKIADVGKLFTPAKQIKEEGNLEACVLNYNKSKNKKMAENIKESPLKEEKEEQEPHDQNVISDHLAGNNNHLGSNLYQNYNTQQYERQQHIITCPITPQAQNSTLQSTLNATNNSVAAAGLQPNFLSQLALTANVPGLQKSTTTAATILTAKQLNQSFNILDSSNQNKSDSTLLESTTLTTSVPAVTYDNNGQAKILLICEGNSHPFQSRTISLTPNVECMVGRLIAKSKASENNAIFDCKVLSRKHAVIWYTPDGKFWVKDTKSSNGTFINDNKLGDEEAELHFGDIVKFGVDVLENSRKEVHGCIIACVKLFLPDGREAISIDSSAHRSQYSGEGSISYDELHRLNLYIQETSQREKILTSKLCNIQNVLDATRKNSALCWQSMITEDQLLHRIHSLEKKLQFMEKNVPDNILRNEVLKLLDDKSSYQQTAKEALRKVYQERCEAMQMLAKMETAYSQSDNECSLLRDQIMNSKQTLQDVNTRLLQLETEYNEYKDEVARLQYEAKDREEQRIAMLTEKLRERQLECEELKKKISDFLIKRAEPDDEGQALEKQALENVDPEDMVDSDEISEEEENKLCGNNEDEGAKEVGDIVGMDTECKFTTNTRKSTVRPQLASIFGNKLNGVEAERQQQNSKINNADAFGTPKHKSPPKRIKETTIMKWLQNSDINKTGESFDIFKAICNEQENDDDEPVDGIFAVQELKDTKCMQMPDSLDVNKTNLFINFTYKLKNVQKNLKQLELEIEEETKKESFATNKVKLKTEKMGDESSDEDDAKEGAIAAKSNGKTSTQCENQVLSKEKKKYLLLKSSVNMLRDAYNEIRDSVKEQETTLCHKQYEQYHEKEKVAQVETSNFDSQPKLQASESDNTETDSEVESLTFCSSANSSHNLTVVNVKTDKTNEHQVQEYQSQVISLNEKLQQTELEAQHTLEIMQIECDDVKLKMDNLNKIIEALKNDKKSLEKIINEYQNNAAALKTSWSSSAMEIKDRNEIDDQLGKEFEFEEDPILNAIDVTALEREEELITYKERLEEQQRENIDLRNEITLLKQKTKVVTTKDLLLKQYLPCSIIVLAIIIYFLTTYY